MKLQGGVVYGHGEIGLYTNGVRTLGSVREGRKALVTVRSGECAQGLKPLDIAQEVTATPGI